MVFSASSTTSVEVSAASIVGASSLYSFLKSYSIYYATIIAYGLQDASSNNHWIHTHQQHISTNIQHALLTKTKQYDKAKRLLAEHMKNMDNIRQQNIIKNTANFSNLSHCINAVVGKHDSNMHMIHSPLSLSSMTFFSFFSLVVSSSSQTQQFH